MSVLEKDFQRTVIELAHTFGWRVAHFRTAMNARGAHMTPVAADGKGWPDLAMVNPETRKVMFVELKSTTGKLSVEQAEWGAWLLGAGLDWQVWRPEHIQIITATLSAGKAVAL